MTTKTKGRNGGDRPTHKHFKDSANYIKPILISHKQKRGGKGAQR